MQCLSPHGESGLKSRFISSIKNVIESLPARGEWIEIFRFIFSISDTLSLPARGEWIEIPIIPSTTK